MPFLSAIETAVGKAARKVERPKAKGSTQKDIVLDHLEEVIGVVSDDGRYRFN